MATCNPIELAEASGCFLCLTPSQKRAAGFSVLCDIAENISPPGPVVETINAPASFPWPATAPTITLTRTGGPSGVVTANIAAVDYLDDIAYTRSYFLAPVNDSPAGDNANNGTSALTPKNNLNGIYAASGSRTTSWKATVRPGYYFDTGGSSPFEQPVQMDCPTGKAIFALQNANGTAAFGVTFNGVTGCVLHSGACYKWQAKGGAAAGGGTTQYSRTGNVVTITTASAHSRNRGSTIHIAGLSGAGAEFNGMRRIETRPTTTSFTFTLPGANVGVTPDTGGVINSAMAGVLDLTDLNEFGIPATMNPATSVANCIASPRTWYFDGTDVYVHLFDDRVPDMNVIGYITGVSWMLSNRGHMMRNITVVGGTNVWQQIDTVPADSTLVVTKDCERYACVATSDLIPTVMDRGFVFREGEKSAYGGLDGLNYTHFSAWVNACVFELNCTAFEHGTWVPFGAENCSTIHLGWKATRVGGTYVRAGNKCLADIGKDGVGGGSWNVNCRVGRAAGTTAGTNISFSIGSSTPYLGGKMWCDACTLVDGLASNLRHIEIIGDAEFFYRNMDISGWTVSGGVPQAY